MKRKVIQIAQSTQLISLPRKWAKKFGIKKGDELEVEEKGSSVTVSTSKDIEAEKVTIKFDETKKFLKRPLSTLYKL
jgi:bifunctional DNA-binding transcriptional regulator/antitoxin component of YhaV-PrlF toxin-antitoxin module